MELRQRQSDARVTIAPTSMRRSPRLRRVRAAPQMGKPKPAELQISSTQAVSSHDRRFQAEGAARAPINPCSERRGVRPDGILRGHRITSPVGLPCASSASRPATGLSNRSVPHGLYCGRRTTGPAAIGRAFASATPRTPARVPQHHGSPGPNAGGQFLRAPPVLARDGGADHCRVASPRARYAGTSKLDPTR